MVIDYILRSEEGVGGGEGGVAVCLSPVLSLGWAPSPAGLTFRKIVSFSFLFSLACIMVSLEKGNEVM